MRKWILPALGVVSLGFVVAGAQTLVGSKEERKTDEPKPASNRIVKVTVYPNSALVTREVDVPAGNGLAELVVPGLPIRIIDSSLYSEGTNGLRILSTRFRTRQL